MREAKLRKERRKQAKLRQFEAFKIDIGQEIHLKEEEKQALKEVMIPGDVDIENMIPDCFKVDDVIEEASCESSSKSQQINIQD